MDQLPGRTVTKYVEVPPHYAVLLEIHLKGFSSACHAGLDPKQMQEIQNLLKENIKKKVEAFNKKKKKKNQEADDPRSKSSKTREIKLQVLEGETLKIGFCFKNRLASHSYLLCESPVSKSGISHRSYKIFPERVVVYAVPVDLCVSRDSQVCSKTTAQVQSSSRHCLNSVSSYFSSKVAAPAGKDDTKKYDVLKNIVAKVGLKHAKKKKDLIRNAGVEEPKPSDILTKQVEIPVPQDRYLKDRYQSTRNLTNRTEQSQYKSAQNVMNLNGIPSSNSERKPNCDNLKSIVEERAAVFAETRNTNFTKQRKRNREAALSKPEDTSTDNDVTPNCDLPTENNSDVGQERLKQEVGKKRYKFRKPRALERLCSLVKEQQIASYEATRQNRQNKTDLPGCPTKSETSQVCQSPISDIEKYSPKYTVSLDKLKSSKLLDVRVSLEKVSDSVDGVGSFVVHKITDLIKQDLIASDDQQAVMCKNQNSTNCHKLRCDISTKKAEGNRNTSTTNSKPSTEEFTVQQQPLEISQVPKIAPEYKNLLTLKRASKEKAVERCNCPRNGGHSDSSVSYDDHSDCYRSIGRHGNAGSRSFSGKSSKNPHGVGSVTMLSSDTNDSDITSLNCSKISDKFGHSNFTDSDQLPGSLSDDNKKQYKTLTDSTVSRNEQTGETWLSSEGGQLIYQISRKHSADSIKLVDKNLTVHSTHREPSPSLPQVTRLSSQCCNDQPECNCFADCLVRSNCDNESARDGATAVTVKRNLASKHTMNISDTVTSPISLSGPNNKNRIDPCTDCFSHLRHNKRLSHFPKTKAHGGTVSRDLSQNSYQTRSRTRTKNETKMDIVSTSHPVEVHCGNDTRHRYVDSESYSENETDNPGVTSTACPVQEKCEVKPDCGRKKLHLNKRKRRNNESDSGIVQQKRRRRKNKHVLDKPNKRIYFISTSGEDDASMDKEDDAPNAEKIFSNSQLEPSVLQYAKVPPNTLSNHNQSVRSDNNSPKSKIKLEPTSPEKDTATHCNVGNSQPAELKWIKRESVTAVAIPNGSPRSRNEGQGRSLDDAVMIEDDPLEFLPECFIKSEMFQNDEEKINRLESYINQIQNVVNLETEHLEYLVMTNERYLRDIFQGKIKCRRHQDYKAGGKTRVRLSYQLPVNSFSEDQRDKVVETLTKIFCRNHLKYLDYILKVLLPEMLIKIYMDIHKTLYTETEAILEATSAASCNPNNIQKLLTQMNDDT